MKYAPLQLKYQYGLDLVEKYCPPNCGGQNGQPSPVKWSSARNKSEKVGDISCQTCVHFDGHYACPAYPNGVPMSLYLGVKKHDHVLGCQDGELVWDDGKEEHVAKWYAGGLVAESSDKAAIVSWTVETFCPPNCGGTVSAEDAHAAVDKIKGTRETGRPKTDISVKEIFGRRMATPQEMDDVVNAMDKLKLPTEKKSVELDKLIPTQSVVQRPRLHANIDLLTKGKAPAEQEWPPTVYKSTEGKLYIKDGHHRLAAAKLLGHKTFAVVLKLAPESTAYSDYDNVIALCPPNCGPAGANYSKEAGWTGTDGKPLSSNDQARLKALGIPPGWKNIQLNPNENASLQVKGYDKKGRVQYKYSSVHSEKASAEKFARLRDFNDKMPGIISGSKNIMLDKNKSIAERDAAAVVYLMAKTGFRPGTGGKTLADKRAFGAATLEGRHIKISGDTVSFSFIGKKGVEINQTIKDKNLSAYLKMKNAGPDGKLFSGSSKIKDVFESVGGKGFLLKDMRTWNGTARALEEVGKMPKPTNEKEYKKSVLAVAKAVSAKLGNTPSVALSSYISKEVFHSWQI